MTKNNIVLQRATLAYADTLLTFSRKTFFDFFAHLNDPANMEAYASTAFTTQKVKDELSNPDSHFYFAVLDGEITGYIKINFNAAQTELQDSQSLEVERIYVLAEHHGKKIGHQLLNFALQTARDMGLQYVWLGVWEHNQKAIDFYRKHGFDIFGSHPFMLGSEQQTDLLMKKELSE
ncbi:GNAT family N-acetyltransferase [Mucilaginibacter sabulilitoris]|uniref:GNAT family N-acetyltransferase n=1 Tax=Mucilaginibacter sabulilitoris TaxID=1173583 RepID=A0ABZ0TCP6_9SPHI|nr:GNAT family N-acetyltransferase [Mucilaginibacter sabulilitoris]WPU90992.1 GNAT family N-acetyltransferase [Mucilaginibacter sabulilitoris]